MNKLIKNLGKKIIPCPQCGLRLRVPIKSGKTLRITCSKCTVQFDIRFTNPFSEFFTWYKGRGMVYNLKSYFLRFKLLPIRAKFIIITLIIFLIFTLNSLKNRTSTEKEQLVAPKEKIYEVI